MPVDVIGSLATGEPLAIGRCSECKHWGNTKYPGIYAQDGMKDCERMQEAGYADTDGEPCTTSTIGTAPDFGCVLFEKKEGA